ncbi:MAG: DEAD/DEAH box helicase, partial [Chloroflexota bacterium]
MTLTFASLGLQPTLLNTLNELDYDDPTPIQAQAIPLALSGKDILGQAQTGTGKTAAFTLPVLHQMSGYALQTLILAPTRELAIQVSQAVYQYSKGMDLKVLPVYGGTAYDRQIRRIKKGVQVIVGTPGRTLDLINKGILRLDDIRYVILDEADEMLRLGFIEDVESILSSVPKTNRQTLLFSATFSNPVLRLAQNYMQDPVHVEIEAEQVTADNIDQHYFVVRNADKVEALSRLLETETYQNVLVFTRTKVGSAELAQTLIDRGYPAVAIHGDLAQNERERILRGFRDGKLNVLVATDVVGRGVDLSDITHVINYDVPQLPIDYVHRIGRTGRAGRAGTAMTFITGKEHYRIKKIESFIETKISKAKLPTGEDVQTARDTRMRAKLVGHIDKVIQDGTDDFELIDSLLADGYDAEQIVSGMMAMLRAESNDY